MISVSGQFYLVLDYIYLKSNIYSKIKYESSTFGHLVVICVKMDACQIDQFRAYAQLRSNHRIIIYLMVSHVGYIIFVW